MNNVHIPVLIQPILEDIKANFDCDSILSIFDGTLGGGGYTEQIVNLLPKSIVYGGDLDSLSLERVEQQQWYKNHSKHIHLLHGNFADLISSEFLDNTLDIIVLDLGFSSNQLDVDKIGLSYLQDDEILDLRYDRNSKKYKPLYELLQHPRLTESELIKIIYNSSGEKLAPKIARKIIERNKENNPLKTVGQLKELIISVIPAALFKQKYSILSKVWQAFRIHVNGEFENLEKAILKARFKLRQNGRLYVVSFHSLEDKIVAGLFRKFSKGKDADDYGNKTYEFIHKTQKAAITPIEEEVKSNIRSRSAGLRILEKCVEGG
jgi:16S rRNA (cytosine1402-N4)-methyltransferase